LMRSGIFPGGQSRYLEGATVTRKTIGIIGMGGVGRASARRAQGFGMQTLYYDPQRLPVADEQELDLTWTPIEGLLARADFVSIHARLTPQTRHLIGEKELSLMKPSAYLINSARGPIVDEQALVQALQTKRIAGAGLDVYENEPQPDAGLLKLPNVVFTPHVGSATVELRDAMANVVVDNILSILDGKTPPNCWNAEIYN
jgi:glyoxylate reductase